MASLDFARDLMDKLKIQGIDYVIVLLQNEKRPRIDIFHEIKDVESLDILIDTTANLAHQFTLAKQELVKTLKKKKKNDKK